MSDRPRWEDIKFELLTIDADPIGPKTSSMIRLETASKRIAELEAEVERLKADFTGHPDQPPEELIRAKCEQYWDAHGVPDAEMHAVLEFIHREARRAETQRDEAVALLRESLTPHPYSEWHEDFGDVLWTTLPVEEPPYCGSPVGDDWPDWAVPEEELFWWHLPDAFRRGEAEAFLSKITPSKEES